MCKTAKGGCGHQYVAKLCESDYLAAEPAKEAAKGSGREGNCMFKYKGKYYFCASDLHGWNSSYSYYMVADNIYGPYTKWAVMDGTDEDFSHVKTADALTDDGDPVVTYNVYRKDVKANETVTVGVNGNSNSVNYFATVKPYEAPQPTEAPKSYIRGDLNQDGCVDVFDLALLKRALLNGMDELTTGIADVNGDGQTNTVDAVRLMQYQKECRPELYWFLRKVYHGGKDSILWLNDEEAPQLCICKKDIRTMLHQPGRSTILTSATIAGKQDSSPREQYKYFLDSIGFPNTGLVSMPKRPPFNYEKNTMLYCSASLPFPKHDDMGNYRECSIPEIVDLLHITQGKTLILFNMGLPYRILLQIE